MTRDTIISLGRVERDALAAMAEKRAKRVMDGAECSRFDRALLDAETALRSRRWLPRKERLRLVKIVASLRALATEARDIASLLQEPVLIEPVMILAEHLEKLAQPSGKSGQHDRQFDVTLCIASMGSAWEIGAKSHAGTASVKNSASRGGHFVEFVRFALTHMDPEGRWDKRPLGGTVRQVSALLKLDRLSNVAN